MTGNLVELPLRCAQRAQGLPPDIPSVVGESPVEATNQGATTDSHVEGNLVMEVGEEFTTCDNLLVELPPMTDNTFHFPMEGHVGSSNWVVNHPSNDTEGT